eukprot:CAMPEP_0194321682 /NCGR_PEP_ID=MMETSP0171-20130528/17881_1 /TAXON_ID=218684 /ORGANISM="Corethron pennatum, Strain L29A3" /LENGTH=854 /DNA_ID=CAMNT_0039079677 /DNA_START=365 /DNA_END=2926 /DNA_ORIENTATION=+
MYVACMRDLCRQIGKQADLFYEELVYLPSDTTLTKAAKSLQAIEKAKLQMSRLMNDIKIFLVLDDVWCHEDVEIFNFGEEMNSSFTLFVTTRTLDMFPSAGACWIDVPLLKPQDAVSLFFLESGRGHPIPRDEDFFVAEKVVMKCGYLPLAIRIAAKVAKAYPDFLSSEDDLEDIPSTIGNVQDASAANQTIVNLLHRSFSIVTDADASYAVKICFGAMAVVFHHSEDILPWISQSMVEMLWAQLFLTFEYMTPYLPKLREYRLNSMNDITQLLYIMGLINKRNVIDQGNITNELQIHHDLLREYGKMTIVQFEKDRGGNTMRTHPSFDNTESLSRRNSSDLEEITIELHSLMVDCYQNKLGGFTESEIGRCYDSHMLHWLPHHMIKARNLKEALQLLMNRSFLRNRIEFLGILEGTKQYASDIQTIQKGDQSNYKKRCGTSKDENLASKSKLNDVLLLIVKYLTDINSQSLSKDSQVSVGRALVFLGVTEQGITMWEESLDCFQKALRIFRGIGLEENHQYIVCILNHINSLSVKPMLLLPENSQYCIRLKYASRFDGNNAGLPLELSSHPDKGIVLMENFFATTSFTHKNNIHFAGIGPKEGSLTAVKEANYLRCTNSNRILRYYFSAKSGIPMTWSSDIEKSLKKSEWIIREDGKVSPCGAPHLCLASSPYTLLALVARGSPNQAIFENWVELEKSRHRRGNNKKGILLKLKSHPNYGIVALSDSPVMSITFISVLLLYFGPAASSLSVRFTEHKELLIEDFGGLVFRPLYNLYEIGNFMSATKDNCDRPRLGGQWQVNKDGSISPVQAAHLALGFPVVGNHVIPADIMLKEEKISTSSDKSMRQHDLLHE